MKTRKPAFRLRGKLLLATLLGTMLLPLPHTLLAQPMGKKEKTMSTINCQGDYWTPERMRKARPLPLPKADEGLLSKEPKAEEPEQPKETPMGSEGQPPQEDIELDPQNRLF